MSFDDESFNSDYNRENKHVLRISLSRDIRPVAGRSLSFRLTNVTVHNKMVCGTRLRT